MEYANLPEFKDIPLRHLAYAGSAFVLLAMVYGFTQEIELKQDVPAEIISQSEIKVQGHHGLVTEIYAQPGAAVQRGEALFRLDRDFSLSSSGQSRDAFDASLRDSQVQAADVIYRQRRHELDARIATASQTLRSREQERAVLARAIAQNQEMIVTAERKLERLKSVAAYVVADRLEQAETELNQLRLAAMDQLSRDQQILSEMTALRGSLTEMRAQLNLLEAQHEREIRDVETRFERERQSAVISAPEAGLVSFSNLLVGRTLRETEVAMVIATGEGKQLQAALSIPSRRRGFVAVGQTVRLKLDAFPYARFGTYPATITAISDTTVAAAAPSLLSEPDKEQAPVGGSDGDYIAWATLPGNAFTVMGRSHKILPGMRATASVVVERRTIAEWLFEPVFRMLRG